MQNKALLEVINAQQKIPTELIKIQNNKIKIDLLWQNRDLAMSFVDSIKSQICRAISINHYIWIKYIDLCQEVEDRICVFPPHKAPLLDNTGKIRSNEG